MADYSIFPALNATLNGASAVLITTGRVLIARKKIRLHRAFMIAAVATSSFSWPAISTIMRMWDPCIFPARDGRGQFILRS
jgi:hypothetical protein